MASISAVTENTKIAHTTREYEYCLYYLENKFCKKIQGCESEIASV